MGRAMVLSSALLWAATLIGCASAPLVTPPVLATPPAWETSVGVTEEATELSAPAFWSGFGSPQLQDLLQQVALANPDLLIAADRLQIARDTVLTARAQQQPSLSFNAGPVDTTAAAISDTHARHAAAFELAFNASYELDFWGRLSSMTASAEAMADASALDADTARIGLLSLAAQTYFDLAQADDAAAIEQRRLSLAEERLALQAARQAAQRIDSEPVLEAQAEIDAIRLQLQQSRRQRRSSERQLALLLGRMPEGFSLKTAPLRQQVRLPPVPAGLPSMLLQRRPDLRAAAARLAAAQSRIGVARAEQFPQIRLTAQLGMATDVLHRAASGAFGLFGFGPQISLPIYEGGALTASVDASRREADIALLEYRKAACAAFADVERALQLRETAQAQQIQARDQARRGEQSRQRITAELAAGRSSRLDVISAEEKQLDAEKFELENYRAQVDSLLALFQALGGGWQPASAATPA